MPRCYSGSNPIDDDDRINMWKWVKPHIEAGVDVQKAGQMINDEFYGGQAPPKWMYDIMSGRKTPFRELSNDMWRKQYNRNQVVRQAENLSSFYGKTKAQQALSAIWSMPRGVATFGHGFVFPITHAGDLALNAKYWRTFFPNWLNTYRASVDPAFSARLQAEMENRPLYDMALKSKVDVGRESRPDDITQKAMEDSPNPVIRNLAKTYNTLGRNPSSRAWDALKVMRYQLWEHEVQRYLKPGMTQAEQEEIGKSLAPWANHATGSAKFALPGMKSSFPGWVSNIPFGPKLWASKAARLTTDPYDTMVTLGKMVAGKPTTAGERAVALTRFEGAATNTATVLAGLVANGALLQMMGSKQQVNVTDPTKSDFMNFKGLGLEGGIPGIHTEVATLAKILAVAAMSDDQFKKSFNQHFFPDKAAKYTDIIDRYGRNKLAPQWQNVMEAITGKDAPGREMPWSPKKGGKPGTFFQKLDWPSYLMGKLPIPASGPIAYFVDKLRGRDMSPLDAANVTRGLIMFGLGFTGMHVHEEPGQGSQPSSSPPATSASVYAPPAPPVRRSHHARSR